MNTLVLPPCRARAPISSRQLTCFQYRKVAVHPDKEHVGFTQQPSTGHQCLFVIRDSIHDNAVSTVRQRGDAVEKAVIELVAKLKRVVQWITSLRKFGPEVIFAEVHMRHSELVL